jgi:hypothetical protein
VVRGPGADVHGPDVRQRCLEPVAALRFVEGELTFDCMEATKDYLRRDGKPMAFCTDKHTYSTADSVNPVPRKYEVPRD